MLLGERGEAVCQLFVRDTVLFELCQDLGNAVIGQSELLSEGGNLRRVRVPALHRELHKSGRIGLLDDLGNQAPDLGLARPTTNINDVDLGLLSNGSAVGA